MTTLADIYKAAEAASKAKPKTFAQIYLPAENSKVLFWTHLSLGNGPEHALTGVFHNGRFWIDTDHWQPSEVTMWQSAT